MNVVFLSIAAVSALINKTLVFWQYHMLRLGKSTVISKRLASIRIFFIHKYVFQSSTKPTCCCCIGTIKSVVFTFSSLTAKVLLIPFSAYGTAHCLMSIVVFSIWILEALMNRKKDYIPNTYKLRV